MAAGCSRRGLTECVCAWPACAAAAHDGRRRRLAATRSPLEQCTFILLFFNTLQHTHTHTAPKSLVSPQLRSPTWQRWPLSVSSHTQCQPHPCTLVTPEHTLRAAGQLLVSARRQRQPSPERVVANQSTHPACRRARAAMVEGHGCHRVGHAHRRLLLGKRMTATSPNGRFVQGAGQREQYGKQAGCAWVCCAVCQPPACRSQPMPLYLQQTAACQPSVGPPRPPTDATRPRLINQPAQVPRPSLASC
jgi:hypothetical protein